MTIDVSSQLLLSHGRHLLNSAVIYFYRSSSKRGAAHHVVKCSRHYFQCGNDQDFPFIYLFLVGPGVLRTSAMNLFSTFTNHQPRKLKMRKEDEAFRRVRPPRHSYILLLTFLRPFFDAPFATSHLDHDSRTLRCRFPRPFTDPSTTSGKSNIFAETAVFQSASKAKSCYDQDHGGFRQGQ